MLAALKRAGMIRLLDPETIGQIAAGEVIERPLSVVKELVENALDADATRIAVRVRGGGLVEIEVADDGVGIAPEDLPLAVTRHATSKLADATGLTRVETLGFRGEGLASIAAIAKVTIVSRTAAAEVATAVDAHAGELGEPRPVAGPLGTRVVVRELFANVPVRREYLRSRRRSMRASRRGSRRSRSPTRRSASCWSTTANRRSRSRRVTTSPRGCATSSERRRRPWFPFGQATSTPA